MSGERDRLGLMLPIAASLAVLGAMAMVALYAPPEAVMGNVQRIFYFHVASAWVGFFGFFVTFVSGIIFLVRQTRDWDRLAASSVEVGLTFISMTVITGALWARPVWGTYWTWEPRLTISAVQLVVYVAYVMLRGAVSDPSRRARFAAVYGIMAFVTVPLSWFAIRWWRTIHPDLLASGGGMAVTARMGHTLAASIVAFTLLYVTLVRLRIRLERSNDALVQLRARLRLYER